MAGEVDEVWHDHILDTEDYFSFCRQVIGAIVHHVPSDGLPSDGTDNAYEKQTLPALRQAYRGPLSAVWPTQSDAKAVARCCGHISEFPVVW
jgi:hypothetical protein